MTSSHDAGAGAANAATALATTVVDELVRGGLRHLVLSPGSRSAAAGLRGCTPPTPRAG